jgi:hypothetical protein
VLTFGLGLVVGVVMVALVFAVAGWTHVTRLNGRPPGAPFHETPPHVRLVTRDPGDRGPRRRLFDQDSE